MHVKSKNIALRVTLWVLMLITIILAVMFMVSLNGADTAEAKKAAAQPGLYWTYFLLVVAAFLAIIFPLIYIIRNPKKGVKALVSLVLLCVVVLIAYWCSDAKPILTATSENNPDFSNSTVLMISDTGIIATYILFGVAILLLIYTGIRSIIRNL